MTKVAATVATDKVAEKAGSLKKANDKISEKTNSLTKVTTTVVTDEVAEKTGSLKKVAVKNTENVTKTTTTDISATKKSDVKSEKNTDATSQPENQSADGKSSSVMIQMGAFLSEDLAETQAAKASLLGVPSRVVKTTNANGTRISVVRSRQRIEQVQAQKMVNQLKANDMPALLMID
ncbi:SPOR domain-containing protein [Simonsiella muelleri]|uniref:SPOR domain-containing protein n=1 Tax=Simonsiella muelleri TaxID=72 RepID=UPI0028D5A492|nr:SPOR domain-containing protein [Simonsiella muelleri]